MRVFTEIEKELLMRINDGRGRNLYNLINPWIKGVSFQINPISKSVIFIFENNSNLNFNQRLNDIQSILIQAVNLLKLFEDRGYIFSYINANQLPSTPFTFGQAAINLPSTPYQFPDPRISKMFCEYSNCEIFVTPELEKFINDGFLTREEVRANRQYKTTKTALYIAIIALLFNIGINSYNILKKADKEPKKVIDQNFKNKF